ncbi:Uncharacterised protein [Acinetobacter baumannii]|nr:Uncharacterised protein [Acinetobacter baumannii]
MVIVRAVLRRGEEAADLRAFHHRGVVFIRRQHIVRRLLIGVLDHFEQRLGLLFAVDDPVGVENLVAAVLRVGLRKHIEFDIRRVAPQTGKGIQQVVDLVLRQAEPDVGLLQRSAPCAQHVDRLIRRRLMVREQLFSLLQLAEDGFHHAIVQQRGKLAPLGFRQLRRLDVERQTALQPQHLLQTAVVGDVGGFGRPGGNGARARRDQQQPAFGGVFGERRTVLEQALKFGVFFGT